MVDLALRIPDEACTLDRCEFSRFHTYAYARSTMEWFTIGLSTHLSTETDVTIDFSRGDMVRGLPGGCYGGNG